jgi:hypothetical protein
MEGRLMGRRSRRPAIFLVLSLCLVACSAVSPKPGVVKVRGSRAKVYSSITQLISDSAAVLLATATNQSRVERLYGVAYTVQRVDINSVLAGSNPGRSMELRQLGEVGGRLTITESTQPLIPNATYLLFAEPFHFTSTDNTGQWVVTGALAGEFRYDPASQIARHLDVESPALPSSITLQQVQSELARTRPAAR